uniref:Biopolymer transporter ExbD n=1 Tax=candidate division WOR-3 bacterium TaxID=2052148 RepID=A0A7C4CEH1_UNCW3
MALSFRERGRGRGNPSIPTASMGDIAFLIIIFFMTTSIFSRDKGLKIVLPEKGEVTKVDPKNVLNIGVNEAGQVLIGDSRVPVNIPEVGNTVEDLLEQNKELAIALRVNRRAPYQVMIEVFDQLKKAKAERVSLVPVQEEVGQ